MRRVNTRATGKRAEYGAPEGFTSRTPFQLTTSAAAMVGIGRAVLERVLLDAGGDPTRHAIDGQFAAVTFISSRRSVQLDVC